MASDLEKKKRKERKAQEVRDLAITGATAETVQRTGSAIKEHFVAYSGEDREHGITLKKSLKSLSKNKISDSQPDQSINSQAGFAAELKTAARNNAENIMSGKSVRSKRSDDVSKDTKSKSGQSVGGTNNELYDIIDLDREDGSYIENSGTQLKYVGKDPEGCCNKLLSKKYDKYLNNNVPIEIPKDYYDKVNSLLDERIQKLNNQIKNAEKNGNAELLKKLREQCERAEKMKKLLRKGKLTTDEAKEARLHPRLSTAKDVVKLAHRGGVEAAKYGAITGGGMSFVHNVVDVVRGDKDPKEAAEAVGKDTVVSAGTGYATGFLGSITKAGMQNSRFSAARELSGTLVPSMAASGAVDAAKTVYRLADGQADGTECAKELGKTGAKVATTAVLTRGMQKASSGYLNALSKTQAPAAVVTAFVNTAETLCRFAKGQIDGTECFLELGQSGSDIIMSSMGNVIGRALLPKGLLAGHAALGNVLSGLVGGMVGYALSTLLYQTLATALKEAKMAHEERLRIEHECELAIKAIREYRFEMEIAVRGYFKNAVSSFQSAFSAMHEAFGTGDIDLWIEGTNDITEALGGEVLFNNMDELDTLMKSPDVITL